MDISLKNFSYRLPQQQQALFFVPELKINSGEKILIRGPSGSGKSSFLHALAGLMPATQGEVLYAQNNFSGFTDFEKTQFRYSQLALIFQRLSLIENFSVAENLLLDFNDLARAQFLLRKFQMDDRMEVLVGKLSLGEMQKVAVMRCLMKPFQIMMADEPTSSLDDVSTQIVMNELMSNCANKTFICVSHDHRLEHFFDRTLQLTQFKPLNPTRKV